MKPIISLRPSVFFGFNRLVLKGPLCQFIMTSLGSFSMHYCFTTVESTNFGQGRFLFHSRIQLYHRITITQVYQTKNSVAFSPQASYTATAVNLGFLDRSRYFLFEVAPQLSSRGLVDPVPDPLLLRKSDSAGNRRQEL
jgi:hypothetical protein